jgi:glycosyltransferase involved in cell wall biosynthesis
MKTKVTILSPLPAPYREPVFELLSQQSNWEFQVYYSTDGGSDIAWKGPQTYDIPYYSYSSEILKNLAPKAWKGKPFVGYVNVSIISKLLKNSPDYLIVHGYCQATELMAIAWAILSSTPFALWGDSSYYKDMRQAISWRQRIKRTLLQMIIRQAHGILTIGTANERYWRSYGAQSEQLYLSKYAVSNDFFESESYRRRAEAVELKKQLYLNGKVVFLYVGRLVEGKGVDLLLEGFDQLTQKRRDVGLLIVGDGTDRKALESLAKQHRTDPVIFVGRVDYEMLPLYYAASDVLVFPSSIDAWGLVINEAMACALPVIAAKYCGGTIDLVRDFQNGIVLKELTVGELYHAMDYLAANPAIREEMGRKSREIISDWTYTETISGFLNAVSDGIKHKS